MSLVYTKVYVINIFFPDEEEKLNALLHLNAPEIVHIKIGLTVTSIQLGQIGDFDDDLFLL